jgi:2,4-dienoyl-CoA reductase-like NADH-dependent reductase (Old Yellow Enzyme family)
MSKLFESARLGGLELKNRFIQSATYEGMAGENGEITEPLVKRYINLAKGEVGLIIPGYMYVEPAGRAFRHQTGIHSDAMIPGLAQLVDGVHRSGGTLFFQLAHAGRQTTRDVAGEIPMGPSSRGRDPLNFVKPREMSEPDIQRVIRAFAMAAQRTVKAGADGIQIHAAHGYLVNQFLSPFFNHRKDGWGGSDANRFRFLKEIIIQTKRITGGRLPVIVKLNTHDHTPREGITPSLAARYAKWLGEMGVDGIEVSCGTALYSFMNLCRGDVPVDDLVSGLPWWKKPMGRIMLNALKNKYDLEEGYNRNAAEAIKPMTDGIPIAVVGGYRTVAAMEEVLESGNADFISMSRPFIREPFIVKRIRQGRTKKVACVSCNKCLAAAANNQIVRCYHQAAG